MSAQFAQSLQQYRTVWSMQAWALGSEAPTQQAHQQQQQHQNLGIIHKPSSGDQLVQVSCSTLSFAVHGKSNCIPSPRTACKCTLLLLSLSIKLYMGLHNPIGTTKLAAPLSVHLIIGTAIMKPLWASSCTHVRHNAVKPLSYCTTQ